MPRIESEMLQPGWWGGESGEEEVRKGSSYEYKHLPLLESTTSLFFLSLCSAGKHSSWIQTFH